MRIPKIYKNLNTERHKSITTIDIAPMQLPNIDYVPDIDFDDEKSVNHYVKTIKYAIRSSREYKKLIQFLKTKMDVNSCKFYPKIKKGKDVKVSIEIHHTGFVMEDIVRTILKYRYKNDLPYDVQSVAEQVMYEHYCGNISLTALSSTMHSLIHEADSNLFIPLQFCDFGNIDNFYQEYCEYVDKETTKKFEQYKVLSAVVDNLADIIPDYLDLNMIYYRQDGVDVPSMDKILEIVEKAD